MNKMDELYEMKDQKIIALQEEVEQRQLQEFQSTKDRGIQTESVFGQDGRTSYIRETNYDQTLTSKVIPTNNANPTTPDDYMVPSMMGTFVRTESELSSLVPKANENRSSERRDNARNMISRYLASTNVENSY
jgi:hypothetical protein